MSVRAEIKRLHSPDVHDLARYVPECPEQFGFLLQIIVGPKGQPGEESFDVVVCTTKWLDEQLDAGSFVIGRHYLFTKEYDHERLNRFLAEYVAQCTGDTWEEVAVKIGRLGRWEFEDYVA
jgi:hypothetical protein